MRLSSPVLMGLVVGLVLLAPPAVASPPESPARESPGAVIDVDPEPTRDHAIEQRLQTIYAQLPALEEVAVEVDAGVVHLRGQVLALDAADEAESIARRVEGVVTVENRIEQIHSLERRLRPLIENMRGRGISILMFLPLLLAGLVIIAGSWLIARLLAHLARRSRRVSSNIFVRELAGQLVRASIILAGFVLALELMGATTLIGAVLGTAGVVGLAVGFAFKDMAENYIASILLSLRQPFEPNDLIEVGEFTGRVVRLTSRATILLTLQGNHVRIPNATVFKSTIINYTRNPARAISFKIGVAVEADLSSAQSLACATLSATPGVLADPAPSSLVDEFGGSAMILSISAWIDQRESDWFKVGSEARRRIKVAFEQAGIDIPEPIFRIRTRDLERELSEKRPSGEELAPLDRADVSPSQDITKQIADERSATAGNDLLRPEAPIE